MELPLRGDDALVKALTADTWGNLVYRKTARNFGPIMAAAATTTVAQVASVVPAGGLDPEVVVTPGPGSRARGARPRRVRRRNSARSSVPGPKPAPSVRDPEKASR